MIQPKIAKFILLKHRAFKPQLTGVLESRLEVGKLDRIQEAVNGSFGTLNVLNTELANSIDINLSNGRIAEIPNNWNEERFSFIMVSEIWDDNTLIGEEIFQGYTDHSETAGGRLEHNATVSIDPNMMMYVNRAMKISYSYDSVGNRIPTFQKADSILADNANHMNGYSNDKLNIWRPMDMSIKYHLNHMINGDDDLDPRSPWGVAVTDANEFNALAKYSKSSNEVGGRMVVDLIKAANRNASESMYTFDSATSTPYENMVSDLVENNSVNYQTLLYMSKFNTRNQLSRWSVDTMSKIFPYVSPDVFTVESYNDMITKNTNNMFQFGNTNDMGDDVFSDNQLTRFQKRIVPYLFDAMLSFGFIKFSGKITNKTLDGSIYVEHSIAMNVSSTVNADERIRTQLLKLLYARLMDNETRAILGGLHGEQLVEVVFDMDLSNSNVFINLNNHILKVKVPSLCDSSFSSLIMPESKSSLVLTEMKTLVDAVIQNTDIVNNRANGVVTGW